MEFMGCTDDTFDVIDEASEQFGNSYHLNMEKYEKLDEICDMVDQFVQIVVDGFGCETMTVDVDPKTKELIFNIVCDHIILRHGRNNTFFELAELVDSIRFSKAKPDHLRIKIGVSGLWWRGVTYE